VTLVTPGSICHRKIVTDLVTDDTSIRVAKELNMTQQSPPQLALLECGDLSSL
jgi:hypothetical protein